MEERYEGWLCTSSGWFKHIVPRRTFSNHIITEIVRCVEFCHMSSGWFDCTEPSLSTSLQGKQGVQGAYALVRGGSSTSNLIVEFIPLQLPTNSLRRTKHTPSSLSTHTTTIFIQQLCVFLSKFTKGYTQCRVSETLVY